MSCTEIGGSSAEEPFIVTFQEKGGEKWEYDEFFFKTKKMKVKEAR